MKNTNTYMSTAPEIPQDILEHVVGFLQADASALQACSLASHSLRSASFKYLFKRLKISHRSPRVYTQLLRFLSQYPRISASVDQITLRDYGHNLDADFDWCLSTDPQFPVVMRSLSTLKIFSYQRPHEPGPRQVSLPPPSVSPVYPSSTLTSLEVCFSSYFPLSSLDGLPTLQHLSIVCTSLGIEADIQKTLGSRSDRAHHYITLNSLRVELQILDIRIFTQWILHPLCPIDLSTLRSLTVKHPRSKSGPAWATQMLPLCSSSLETFEVDPVSIHLMGQRIVIVNPGQPSLTITLPLLHRIELDLPSAEYIDRIPFLSDVIALTAVDTFVLRFPASVTQTIPQWGTICRTLLATFPHLKNVVLKLAAGRYRWADGFLNPSERERKEFPHLTLQYVVER